MDQASGWDTEQYYVFSGPDGWAAVEMFLIIDGRRVHMVCPAPRKSVADELALLREMHPTAIIDELDQPEDIAEATKALVSGKQSTW